MSISNTQWHNRSRSFLLPDQLWDTGFCGSLKATVNTSRDPKSSWGFSPRSWLSCLCFRGRKNTRLKAFLAQSLCLRWTSQLRGTTGWCKRRYYLPTRLFRNSRDFPSGKHNPYLELHLPQPASSTASFGFLSFLIQVSLVVFLKNLQPGLCNSREKSFEFRVWKTKAATFYPGSCENNNPQNRNQFSNINKSAGICAAPRQWTETTFAAQR